MQIGLSGGGLIEVLKKQVKSASPSEEGPWQDVTGDEEIAANLAGLSDGQSVQRSSDQR